MICIICLMYLRKLRSIYERLKRKNINGDFFPPRNVTTKSLSECVQFLKGKIVKIIEIINYNFHNLHAHLQLSIYWTGFYMKF